MSNVTLTPTVGAAALTGALAGNWPSTGFLYVTEFGSLLLDSKSGSALPRAPSLADQLIPFNGGVSVASAAFNRATRVVRLHATAVCSLQIGGTSPVAGGTCRLAASTTEFYAVAPGDALAVVATT